MQNNDDDVAEKQGVTNGLNPTSEGYVGDSNNSCGIGPGISGSTFQSAVFLNMLFPTQFNDTPPAGNCRQRNTAQRESTVPESSAADNT